MLQVITPMQRQYQEIKVANQDSLLFFRLGDFYELFYEDAEVVSKELGLTLTSRHKNSEREMRMCGVPYHSADKYLARLTQKGYKIAICEQVSDPSLPGIVKREVVRIITPGTTFQEEVLQAKQNNYLLSITEKNNQFGVAFVDLTTGELKVTAINEFEQLKTEINRLKPAEVIFPAPLFSESELRVFLVNELKIMVSKVCNIESAYEFLTQHFQIKTLRGMGLEKEPLMIQSVANLLQYLKITQKSELAHLCQIKKYQRTEFMNLDVQTIRNLELFRTIYEGDTHGSLLNVIDQTQTSLGGRLLRRILLEPLLDKNKIEARLEAVRDIYENQNLAYILDNLKQTFDLERILARLSCDRGSARDLVALKETLRILPQFVPILSSVKAKRLRILAKNLDQEILSKLIFEIEKLIVDDPPLSVHEGKMIRDGVDPALDELRKIKQGGQEWLKKYQEEERKRTGITTLKVNFNRVFGYFIEISKGQADKAPVEYTRKQTLTNAERYITPVLKEYEEKVLTAEEKIVDIEYQLYKSLELEIIKQVGKLQLVAKTIAWLDVFSNFARVAQRNNYICPQISNGQKLRIEQGRHPVVERLLTGDELFVPNDFSADKDKNQLILLTGPNMAGKSTYLRQNALIVLLAQIGSFVPAKEAEIAIVDRIFTRIGAADNLSQGQSTFMVEMQETANILRHATERSLLILDEIGRGTSTYDGLSLAWAIFEYIHQYIGAKTLFATHYHELIELAERLEKAVNLNMAVKENSAGVIFLRQVVPGGADQSYGIEVAKLAGIPPMVIENAAKVLAKLEEKDLQQNTDLAMPSDSIFGSVKPGKDNQHQLSFFVPKIVEKVVVKEVDNKITQELIDLNLNQMTPIEAWQKLNEWQKQEG